MDRVQFRSEASLDGNVLSGLAHVYGERALINGKSDESFSAGAFDKALETSDVRAFMEHDRAKLLGRQKSGTLRVRGEKIGLAYEVDLPDTTYSNDLKELVRRGDLQEMSFGFIPGEFEWTKAPDGLPERRHTQVQALVDVSPVALAAFEGTSVQLRADGFAAHESTKSAAVKARQRARSKA